MCHYSQFQFTLSPKFPPSCSQGLPLRAAPVSSETCRTGPSITWSCDRLIVTHTHTHTHSLHHHQHRHLTLTLYVVDRQRYESLKSQRSHSSACMESSTEGIHHSSAPLHLLNWADLRPVYVWVCGCVYGCARVFIYYNCNKSVMGVGLDWCQ